MELGTFDRTAHAQKLLRWGLRELIDVITNQYCLEYNVFIIISTKVVEEMKMMKTFISFLSLTHISD